MVYPNPFSTSAIVEINIDEASESVELILTDMQGREVNKLMLGNVAKGVMRKVFYKNNLSPGMYFYTVRTASDLSNAATVFGTGKLVVQ